MHIKEEPKSAHKPASLHTVTKQLHSDHHFNIVHVAIRPQLALRIIEALVIRTVITKGNCHFRTRFWHRKGFLPPFVVSYYKCPIRLLKRSQLQLWPQCLSRWWWDLGEASFLHLSCARMPVCTWHI